VTKKPSANTERSGRRGRGKSENEMRYFLLHFDVSRRGVLWTVSEWWSRGVVGAFIYGGDDARGDRLRATGGAVEAGFTGKS